MRRIDKHDLLIDLAQVKHLSKKMKETGQISRKVLKKWKNRAKKILYPTCKHTGGWLPYTVIPNHSKHFTQRTFWWWCRQCRSISTAVWEDEISETQRREYAEYIHRDEG